MQILSISAYQTIYIKIRERVKFHGKNNVDKYRELKKKWIYLLIIEKSDAETRLLNYHK